MGRPYKLDQQAAKEAEFRFENNPFEPGTRRHKMFGKFRQATIRMNDMFDDLEEVYGSAGLVLRKRINNKPWSPPKPSAAHIPGVVPSMFGAIGQGL
jgi:hypothetical protein